MMKKLFSAFLVLLLMLGMIPVGSAWLPPEPWEDDYQYPVEGGILYFEKETGRITKYRNTDSSVTKVTLPEEIDGVAVTTIAMSAFSMAANLTEITLSRSITTIEEQGLAYCKSLENITIPANVETIGECVFDCCISLKGIWVEEDSLWFSSDEQGFLFNKDKTVLRHAPLGFSGTYIVPDGVEEISRGAFSRCDGLVGVELSDSVRILQNCVFEYCDNLSRVKLSENLHHIGTYAFSQCLAMTSIELPDSLKSLGVGAFSSCNGLTEVVIPEGVTTLPAKLFFASNAIKSVTIPRSVRFIEYSAFEYCRSLTDVYYASSKDDWNRINVERNNETLLNANIHFNCNPNVGCNGEFVRSDELNSGDEVLIVCVSNNYAMSSAKQGVSQHGRGILVDPVGGKVTYAPDEIIWHVEKDGDGYFFSQNGQNLSLDETNALQLGAEHDRWELKKIAEKQYYVKNADTARYIGWFDVSLAWQTTVALDYWAADCVLNFYVKAKETVEPPEDPTEPPEDPTEPPEEPTEPTEESTEPTEESTEPTEESTEPTEESTEPTEESTEPTEESTEPTEETTEPTEEPTEPSEPTEPIENPFVDVKEEDYFYSPVLWAVENGITNGVSQTRFAPEVSCTRGQIVTFLWRANGCPEPTSTVSAFSDVHENAYYFKAVIWAIEEGITLGVGGGRFAPDESCTRAQVVTFLWRSMGKPAPKNEIGLFTDVGEKAYYCKAVAWAVENGITMGVGGGRFAPEASCTRGQIVTFLCRAMT